jgi:hypothetical protein
MNPEDLHISMSWWLRIEFGFQFHRSLELLVKLLI